MTINPIVADAIGYLGAAFTAAMAAMQAWRIRQRGTEGVSPSTWTAVLCIMTFWLAYGIGTDLLPLVVGNVVCMAFVLFTLATIGIGPSLRALWAPAAIAGIVMGLPIFIWGWDAGLPGAAIYAIGLAVPQIVDLYRTDTAAGVSATAWITGSVSVVIWIIYGILIGRWTIVATDTVVLATNIVIIVLTRQRHRVLARLEAVEAGASA